MVTLKTYANETHTALPSEQVSDGFGFLICFLQRRYKVQDSTSRVRYRHNVAFGKSHLHFCSAARFQLGWWLLAPSPQQPRRPWGWG